MKILSSIAYSTLAALLLTGCGGTSQGSNENNNSDNTKPIFTSAATSTITEGSRTLTIQATDDDTITYSIAGGADEGRFLIGAQSGILTFKAVPDFENPEDANSDNDYIVTIRAEDSEGNFETLTITITISNDTSDDGPPFTSLRNFQIQENNQLNFTVDATGAVKYIMTGEDQKRFEFNTSTGKLSFLNFIPDFEHPSDANHDNNYTINILASDSNDYNNTQALTIEILNDATDDASEENRVTIYKTGADDGIVAGEPFGADRAFTAETIGGDRVIHVGERIWQDDAENVLANYTFEEAQTYCMGLDYAGQSGWRVPNRHEMYEIINYDYNNTYSTTGRATIDNIFMHSTDGKYRTSDNILGHSGQVIYNEAFVVNFRSGLSHSSDRDEKSAVRCVRGDTLIYNKNIEKGGDDTYYDSKTGLQWAQPVGPESIADAKNRCQGLNFAEKQDWRVPNINELHTIMPSTDIASGGYPYGKIFLLGGITIAESTVGPYWNSTQLRETNDKYMGRYIGNYWNYGVWAEDTNESNTKNIPLGRDVQNDHAISLDNADSIFSICVRGGQL